jgi:hypothetical protein
MLVDGRGIVAAAPDGKILLLDAGSLEGHALKPPSQTVCNNGAAA